MFTILKLITHYYERKRTMSNDEIFKNLMAGGKSRDAAIFEIYKHPGLSKSIRNTLKGYEQCRQDWKIIFAESIATLVEKIALGQFEGSGFHSIKAYLNTTSLNNCRNKKRKSDRKKTLPSLNGMEKSPEENLIKTEQHQFLREILSTLGKNCKSILLLFYNDYSYEEIAKQLHLNSSDVAKTSKHRCMKRLKEHLKTNPELFNFFKDN